MIVEHTRFLSHGLTCLIQRDAPNWPYSSTDQTFRVFVDGVLVAVSGAESDALRYARSSAYWFSRSNRRLPQAALPFVLRCG